MATVLLQLYLIFTPTYVDVRGKASDLHTVLAMEKNVFNFSEQGKIYMATFYRWFKRRRFFSDTCQY